MATTIESQPKAPTGQALGQAKVTDVAPDLLAEWLGQGGTVLVDVREDFEHAEERIAGSILAPLSKFDPETIRRLHPTKRVVFHCRSGKRSTDAATRFARSGEPVFHLAGGIEGWKAAGRAVVRPEKRRGLPIMRQVQLIAGSLVVLGVVLGVVVSPWFLALSAFVGCGLTFAGATGWCGMALLLAKMPWNRTTKLAGASCCTN